jgi:ribonuclease BN (tRNA processing enzyme)
MDVQFLGSGDAFGSGGRFNACLHVRASSTAFLVDCGASSMVAIRKFGVDPNTIRTVLISHLHGDHFGGVPFLVLDAQLVSRRTGPLTIAGPPGLRTRLAEAMEAFFPGSTQTQQKFALDVQELEPRAIRDFEGFRVTPHVVKHASGAPPFALRIEADGKVLCYSGDTEWTDELATAARGADLFVAEAYFYDKAIKFHLDYVTLAQHLPEIGAKRVVLTHLSQDMLGRLDDVKYQVADDGLVIEV